MSSAIRLQHVDVVIDRRAVVRDVSVDLAPGEILSLVGPSGSGKTTILRVITGFVAPSAGAVYLNGRVASGNGRVRLPPEERNVAMVFQDLALWPHLTVHGNLAFGMHTQGVRASVIDERIVRMLERVGLASATRRYPGELSGGERQRVAIARALVLEPEAILLDEPLSNVDVGLKRELTILIGELLRERHVTTIYVTHDPREAVFADRVAVMEQGRIVQAGTLTELVADPATAFVRLVVDELEGST